MARVLVVEDDADVATLIATVRTGAGHEVDVARDGGEGLTSAYAGSYEVVILDWMMPVATGIEVCERLRADARFESTRIMMLTARSSPSDMTRARQAGADDYVVKPFAPRELRQHVATLAG